MKTARIRSLAALAAGLLLGCGTRPQSATEFEVVAAVRRYNERLVMAYGRGSAAPLDGVATGDEMQRVEDVIGFLAQGKRVMDARQESFAPGRVSFPEADRADVEVEEVWWYRHWIPSTGEVKQAPRRVRYRNAYHLARADGRWLVDRLRENGYEELR